MDEQWAPAAASEGAGASRRVVLHGIAWAGAVVASMTASPRHVAAVQEATPDATAAPQPFAGETFVGATSDPNIFVAIVVAEAAAGEAARQARGYLCNGADLAEWLDQGEVTGEGTGQLALRSSSGAQIVGEVGEESAAGTITLPDGAEETFEALPATGADGLYTFTLTPDGRVQGSSAGGARIEGELQIAGTITLPDGEETPYAWPAKLDDTADLRTIYREETGRRGAGDTRKGGRLVVEP